MTLLLRRVLVGGGSLLSDPSQAAESGHMSYDNVTGTSKLRRFGVYLQWRSYCVTSRVSFRCLCSSCPNFYSFPPSIIIEWMHYCEVIMSATASLINGVSIVYLTVSSGADHRKHQSSTSLAFMMGIHRWPVNSPHKGPVTRKMLPFDDVIMERSK